MSLQIVVIQHDGIASVVLLPRNDKIRNTSYITRYSIPDTAGFLTPEFLNNDYGFTFFALNF